MPETLTLDKLTPQQLKIFWNEVARKSTLHEFLYNFLGFKDLNSIHKDLCQFLETKHLFKLILMPRYTFKSSICTIGKTLHELNKDSNQRILIYSDASDKATGFLTSIKGHIEGKAEGSKFYAIYNWGQKDPKQTWNLSEIVIADRKTAYPEASIETAGIETSKVGKHYDGIIFDDIVSDKNVTTKDQMDKVENCFRTALSLLKPDGWVIITGTIWHFGDLYRRIIADNELSGLFQIFIVDGEDDPKYGKYCFSDIGLTKEFLEQKKKQQGTYLYSCLYRNNPVSPESAIFKESNFSFYGAIKPDDLYITGTLDPAGEGKDKSGLTAVGTDYEMNMNILEALEGHWKPSELIDLIINLHYKLKFKIFGLETIFFRRMLKLELMRRIGEEHKDNPTKFPLFGIYEFDSASRQGRGKFTRIMALQPYHERGAIKFPGEKVELLKNGFSSLAYQMLSFTPDHMPEPNDLLDSLADHIPLIRRGGLVKKAELPVNTPAWLEREAMKEEMKNRNRLPRRLRGYVAPLAFS